MRNKKTVCITGGTGFLGRRIVQILKKDYNLKILSRKERKVEGIQTISGDFKNLTFLEGFLKDSHYLIHAVAISNPMKPNIKEINVEFTKNLMKVALKSPKLELVVYISTENVTYRCVDPYTLSKKVAENIVRQFKNTLILRPSIIFGKGDNRYVMLYAKLIKIMPIIPVFSAQDCIIQPIHVNDVAQLVHRGIKKEVCGTYTITGSKPISFKELGIIIADILHKKTFFILIHKSIIEVCLLFSKFFLKRLFYMIKNTLILRNLTEKSIENVFGYKIRSIKKRLEESILL